MLAAADYSPILVALIGLVGAIAFGGATSYVAGPRLRKSDSMGFVTMRELNQAVGNLRDDIETESQTIRREMDFRFDALSETMKLNTELLKSLMRKNGL